MRGKKCVLMLTLMFLLGALIASVPPVKSEPYQYRLHIRESPPGSWIPGVPVQPGPGGEVWVTIDIETPIEYDNTSDGIVGYRFSVQVDPAVLRPLGAFGADLYYFLFDFIDWNYQGSVYYPEMLVGEINATTGKMVEVGEAILGFPDLGVGAGGSSGVSGWYGETKGLARLRFKSLSETAYTPIDIYDAYWVDMNETEHAFDVVTDGHYNDPGFTYLHSQSTLIDLSSPVTTSWHELYPTYCDTYDLNDWIDNDDDILSPCDFIQLNDTWYHVEEVTVTIETKTAYGEEYNSTNSPTTDSGSWTDGANAYANGSGYAWVESTKPTPQSQEYGGYGFAIPTTATIASVRVRLDAWTETNEYLLLNVSENGGSTYLPTGWGPTELATTETTYWVNVTTWTSWTPAKINNNNIWTQVGALSQGGSAQVYLDWIPIEVTYIAPLPLYIDYIIGFDYMDEAIENPNNTMWHELYPVFSNIYNLTGWGDDDATYNLTIGDHIKLNGTTYQVEDLDTDIVISSPVEEPPEFPLGLAVEIGLIVAITYVWWRSRRKTKTTKVTKQPKLAY